MLAHHSQLSRSVSCMAHTLQAYICNCCPTPCRLVHKYVYVLVDYGAPGEGEEREGRLRDGTPGEGEEAEGWCTRRGRGGRGMVHQEREGRLRDGAPGEGREA